MSNCEECPKKSNCKANSVAIAMQKGVSMIEKKYGGLFGKVTIDCDGEEIGGQHE